MTVSAARASMTGIGATFIISPKIDRTLDQRHHRQAEHRKYIIDTSTSISVKARGRSPLEAMIVAPQRERGHG